MAHFVELNTSYQPAKFHWPRLSGSILREVVENKPPPDLHSLKRPSPYRVQSGKSDGSKVSSLETSA